MKRPLVILGVAAVAAVVVWAGVTLPPANSTTAQKPSQADPAKAARSGRFNRTVMVRATPVRFLPSRERIQALGTGKAIREVLVTTDVAGTIEKIHFGPNAEVRQGDPLITLKRQTQAIALRSAKALFDKQRATLERNNKLADRKGGFVSQIDLDESRANFSVAKAALEEAQYEYDRRIIEAPFDGRVNLTDLTVGTYLALGAPVVSITDATHLLVQFNIPETAIAAVATGVKVQMSTPAIVGRRFVGEIIEYDTAVNVNSRNIRVRAQLDNPDQLLRAGTTFLVQIEPKGEPIPVVPGVAITWSNAGSSVWRVTADGKPERVPVVIQRRDGDQVWVEGALQAGDKVISDGALKVIEGGQVEIINNRSEA